MGVGSDRSRSHRRHVPAAAPGLPEAAEICSPSQRNRVDEHSGRITSVDGLAAHCGLGAVASPHQSRSSVHRQRPRRREPIRLGSNNHNGDDHDDRDRIHADGLHSRVQRHIRSTLAATLTFLTCDWSSPVGRSCRCCSAQNLVGDRCCLSCLIRNSGEVWLLL